jgi:hypothetical protein
MTSPQYERDSFAGVIGSTFMVKDASNVTAELVLTRVSELHESSGCRAFSIEFLAPENCNLGQGLYDIEHTTLGKMELFLVPVGLKKGQLELQSIFNLLVEDETNAQGG